ncbi:hypothetical protein C5U48_13000 [Mycolicibacter virginiensis]|uniref:Uncharacterized protein n=1 Tax=Mycolicibacter virginiensis TaxID=1795032 RepID=A0A9X7IM96_9MYCO|nr:MULTISPECIES: hypothetical protein [Mycobacteriaceae]PQM51837.1 hypothetical protein C5U48_13000 [Mycolicibacter virginiensis]
MGLPNATHQASATAVKNIGAYISLHTDAGSTQITGSDEAAGITRKQTTWNAGAWNSGLGRFVYTGSEVNIPVAAGTIKGGGIWSAVSSGTFAGSDRFAGGDVIVAGTNGSIDVTPTVMG